MSDHHVGLTEELVELQEVITSLLNAIDQQRVVLDEIASSNEWGGPAEDHINYMRFIAHEVLEHGTINNVLGSTTSTQAQEVLAAIDPFVLGLVDRLGIKEACGGLDTGDTQKKIFKALDAKNAEIERLHAAILGLRYMCLADHGGYVWRAKRRIEVEIDAIIYEARAALGSEKREGEG